MDLINIAVIFFTLALLVGGIGACLVDAQVRRSGADSVTMEHIGAKLLMRACPASLVAAALITAGAALGRA